jgi:hypothetical protein
MTTVSSIGKPTYIYDSGTDEWLPIGIPAHTHDFLPFTVLNAKGDIITATGNDAPTVLPLGTNGQFLAVNTSTASGLEWASYLNITFNQQTGTSYTLSTTDSGKLVEMSNGSAITLTVPVNSSVPIPIGTQINIAQTNTGQVTVVGASGVVVNASPGLKLRTQWSFATLIKRSTDTWLLVGDLSA